MFSLGFFSGLFIFGWLFFVYLFGFVADKMFPVAFLGRKSHCISEDMIMRLPFILRIGRIQPIRGDTFACDHSFVCHTCDQFNQGRI